MFYDLHFTYIVYGDMVLLACTYIYICWSVFIQPICETVQIVWDHRPPLSHTSRTFPVILRTAIVLINNSAEH